MMVNIGELVHFLRNCPVRELIRALEQIEDFVRSKKMYSPKIKAELVQKLYHLAKARKVPMTRLVNKIIEEYLEKEENKQTTITSND